MFMCAQSHVVLASSSESYLSALPYWLNLAQKTFSLGFIRLCLSKGGYSAAWRLLPGLCHGLLWSVQFLNLCTVIGVCVCVCSYLQGDRISLDALVACLTPPVPKTGLRPSPELANTSTWGLQADRTGPQVYIILGLVFQVE